MEKEERGGEEEEEDLGVLSELLLETKTRGRAEERVTRDETSVDNILQQLEAATLSVGASDGEGDEGDAGGGGGAVETPEEQQQEEQEEEEEKEENEGCAVSAPPVNTAADEQCDELNVKINGDDGAKAVAVAFDGAAQDTAATQEMAPTAAEMAGVNGEAVTTLTLSVETAAGAETAALPFSGDTAEPSVVSLAQESDAEPTVPTTATSAVDTATASDVGELDSREFTTSGGAGDHIAVAVAVTAETASPAPRASPPAPAPVGAGEEHEAAAFSRPPPAPVVVVQPVFSGSMIPLDDDAAKDAADGGGGSGGTMDGDRDSDSDSEDSDTDDAAPLPPPLALGGSPLADDEDELEVDPAVAAEICAARAASSSSSSSAAAPCVERAKPTAVAERTNPLLDALEQADDASKKLTADVLQAHASKLDEIALAFDGGDEVVGVVEAAAHPESSAAIFGIGYQNLRKRQDSASGGDAAYSIRTHGAALLELESEVTLPSDASLSAARLESAAAPPVQDEEDEFGELLHAADGPASPTRVDEILRKSRAAATRDDEQHALVSELKKATDEEKRRLRMGSEASALAANTETSPPDGGGGGNALTLKELHSIYKRGLGDQEVLLLDEAADAAPPPPPPPPLSAMGRILSKPSMATHAISEEDEEDAAKEEEEEDDDDDEKEESLHDEDADADATALDSERIQRLDMGDGDRRGDDDWQEIQLLRRLSATPQAPSASGGGTRGGGTGGSSGNSTIAYADAVAYFLESDDVLLHRDAVVVADDRAPAAAASCFSCFSARPRLAFGGAAEQRERFFCVAATCFDARNTVHVRMLQTIYRRLVGARGTGGDVPLVGPHWEAMGFQGCDPSTDLRGCGVLSLLQLLHLAEAHAELARRFLAQAQHPTRHFPMACASINVTLQSLVALRSGALVRECNRRQSVFTAANALHAALVAQLVAELQTSNDAVPLVIKRVLDTGKAQPDRAIEAFASRATPTPTPNQQQQHQTNASATRNALASRSSHAAAGEFTEIGLHSLADD